jgi:hypothetical protein
MNSLKENGLIARKMDLLPDLLPEHNSYVLEKRIRCQKNVFDARKMYLLPEKWICC